MNCWFDKGKKKNHVLLHTHKKKCKNIFEDEEKSNHIKRNMRAPQRQEMDDDYDEDDDGV
jgi:hypothetical protein